MSLQRREDAQSWRYQLIGKRIVSSDRHVTSYDRWKSSDAATPWEPRIYFCCSQGEGFEQTLVYNAQVGSPLLRLPGEIRNLILKEVVPPQTVAEQADSENTGGNVNWLNTSAIIFCCKQLYAEGRALAVEKHTFEWKKFPKKTRLCAAGKDRFKYDPTM